MIRIIAPPRGEDKFGGGGFGASRGSRKHNGIDYAAVPGSSCLSITKGQVTKLGYPYDDDLSYRYVQVTDNKGNRLRFFYVDPVVKVGEFVDKDTILGSVQSLQDRYPGIKDHIHLEIICPKGNYINPALYAASYNAL